MERANTQACNLKFGYQYRAHRQRKHNQNRPYVTLDLPAVRVFHGGVKKKQRRRQNKRSTPPWKKEAVHLVPWKRGGGEGRDTSGQFSAEDVLSAMIICRLCHHHNEKVDKTGQGREWEHIWLMIRSYHTTYTERCQTCGLVLASSNGPG